MTVQTFLAQAYATELALFRAALDAVPDEGFDAPRLGHSPAWHALHVAEWLRFFVFQDFSPTYDHLGWENDARMGFARGTPPVTAADGKTAVLAELDRMGAELEAHLRALRDDQLTDDLRSPPAPGGVRRRLDGLSLHLRHIAYHRGQLNLALKQD
ncbi:DinB family protein [Deinococcus aquaedulcis]|uniref:DinB family protein n=1 Tax=Deinococcus aquaedulcis TaxID=2840455 RepID=UPI001C83AD7C|nr:DinB family protein [Deinococcus aquaedulcis]